jgi:hypothetical protein
MPKRKASLQYSSEAAKVVKDAKRSGLFSREKVKEWIKRHKETRDTIKKFDR